MRLKDVEIIIGYAGVDHDGLTDEEVKILRDQEVDIDDWDIMVFTSPDILVPREEEYNESEWHWFSGVSENEKSAGNSIKVPDRRYPGQYTFEIRHDLGMYQTVKKTRTVYDCEDWTLDRMLPVSYDKKWYLIDWKGKKTALGVAYH